MEYSEITHHMKISLIRGYAFFGLVALCWIIIIILVIVYGPIGSYDVDPDNPDIMRGDKHDMQKDVFARYDLVTEILLGICFLGSLVGVILYGYWKKWSFLKLSNKEDQES